MKIKLKEKDWDNQEACMKEAVRLGFTARIGYHAWCAGQGANGYESVLDFFKDIGKLLKFKTGGKEMVKDELDKIFVKKHPKEVYLRKEIDRLNNDIIHWKKHSDEIEKKRKLSLSRELKLELQIKKLKEDKIDLMEIYWFEREEKKDEDNKESL